MTMKYYPVNLTVADKDCLIVGGGAVGARKASTLVQCNAMVTVISPEFHPSFHSIDRTRLRLVRKNYTPSDLKGRFMVMGATDDQELNARIARDANRKNILCNIVDAPELSSFIVPAVVNRGDLIIAVSTSGNSPAFAKQLRKDLEKQFGQEYADFLGLMGTIRKKLLQAGHAPEEHRALFKKLIDRGLLNRIAAGQKNDIDTLLLDVLGSGYSLRELESGDDL